MTSATSTICPIFVWKNLREMVWVVPVMRRDSVSANLVGKRLLGLSGFLWRKGSFFLTYVYLKLIN